MEMTFPTIDDTFVMTTVPAKDDYILHVDDDNCERFGNVQQAVEDASATTNVLNQVTDEMENSGFFNQIRNLTGNSSADSEELYDNLNYMYWMKESQRELSFELTAEQWNRTNITVNRKVYYKFDGYIEETSLAALEFMQVQSEFAQILQGDIEW